MSTRAILAIRLPDETILATYLHFDGYPDHVMPILTSGYVDPDEALELIQAGELRCLPPRPNAPEYFETSRRTSELTSADELPALSRYLNAEHVYLMNQNGWTHLAVADYS
ncbi:hypothetical protein LF1_08190 [Rubripirellula obstinata]|uniref:Uncharacterized protein n=1 Tax=Rubripirellula obstinata TaxID=406547 RepID=A0A5B1CFN7_9BACT|nr:hypothetical protein [Rubripirellula obstinata]KAA1258303.1 hypothetical protein LF1_08190 [Rubripirellula obstinata]